MPLAKLTELKPRIGIASDDTAHDTDLTTLLTNISGWLDHFCGRVFLYTAADITELFDGDGWDLRVVHFPITSLVSIKEDGDHVFGTVTALTERSDFLVRYARGIIVRQPSGARWLSGEHTVQVVYRCGYNDPAAAAVPGVSYVPPHVQEACLQQAVDLWNRKGEPGYKVVFAAGPNVSGGYAPEIKLLPGVKELLAGEHR